MDEQRAGGEREEGKGREEQMRGSKREINCASHFSVKTLSGFLRCFRVSISSVLQVLVYF